MTRIAIYLAILLLCVSCSHKAARNTLPTNQANGGLSGLAAPQSLRQGSSTGASWWTSGAGYVGEYPNQAVVLDGTACTYSPTGTGALQLGQMAYSIYEFTIGYPGDDPVFNLDWVNPPEAGDVWIGLSYWAGNRWIWQPASDAASVPLPQLGDYLDGDNRMLVVLALAGSGSYTLASAAVNGTSADCWAMFGHDARHTRRSMYTGPQTTAFKWDYETNAVVGSSPAVGWDGTVYITDVMNYLYAISADGQELWTKQLPYDLLNHCPAIGPDGTIYLGTFISDGRLYAFNPDGSEKWVFVAGSDGSVYSNPVVDSNGVIYFTFKGATDALFAVNPDGTKKWSCNLADLNQSTPAVSPDGYVYLGSNASTCKLYCVKPDGTFNWEYPVDGAITTAPAIDDNGVIYFGSVDGVFYAVNPDGTPAWDYDTDPPKNFASSPAIGSDGTIYVGCMDNNFYAFEPDGDLKWIRPLPATVNCSPAIGADDLIYFACNNEILYALNPDDGSVKWTYWMPAGTVSSPAISPDGSLYLGSMDNCVLAFHDRIPPNISMVYPKFCCAGQVLDASVRFSGLEDENTLYSWDFGGGATPNTSTAKFPEITIGAAGEYNASVTVDNGFGDPTVYQFTMTVFADNQQGEWWCWGRDAQNTRQSSVSGPQTNRLLWTYDTKGRFKRPAVVDVNGTVYAVSEYTSSPVFTDNLLYAINPDGTVKWTYEFEGQYISTPAISREGVLHFTSENGFCYALGPDGELIWSTRVSNESIAMAPVLDGDGNVYFAADRLFKIDRLGNIVWSSEPDYFQGESVGLATDGSIYVSAIYYFYALNPDGSEQWSTDFWGYMVGAPIVAANGTVYITQASRIYALTSTGEDLWNYQIQGNGLSPLAALGVNGDVYAGSAILTALDGNGTYQWTQAGYPAPAVGADGTLYIGGGEDWIYAYKPDGTVKWSYETDGTFKVSPALSSDGMLIVLDSYGKIYAFKDE